MTRLPAFDYVQGGAIADFLLVHPDQAEIANAELPLNPHSAVGCQVCDLPVPGVRRRPRPASIVMVPTQFLLLTHSDRSLNSRWSRRKAFNRFAILPTRTEA